MAFSFFNLLFIFILINETKDRTFRRYIWSSLNKVDKMKSKYGNNILIAVGLIFVAFSTAYSALQYEYSYEVSKTGEQELQVRIESSLNKIIVSRSDKNSVFSIKYNNKEDETPEAKVSYSIHNKIGYLNIHINEEDENQSYWTKQYNTNSYYIPKVFYITLSNSTPIKLDLHLGAGYGKIDMTGLQLKDVKLETGAAETVVMCNEPNPIVLETFRIDAGLSKFHAYNIGNTNFKNLYFEGGVGSYFFDFNGALRREAFIKMELGLGSMYMVIPKNIGASIRYDEGFLSTHSFEDFREVGDGKFISGNYYNSDGRLTISIESGLGSIQIKRTNENK
jgi:hypothetical protein